MTVHYLIQDARSVYPNFLGLPPPTRRHLLADLGKKARRRLVTSLPGPHCPDLEEATGPFGKPYLSPSLWQVNSSHSGPWLVAVASRCWAVGVDIQEVVPKRAQPRVAGFFMHPRELAYFGGLANEDEATRFFFTLWAQKEALLKAWGTGFTYPPSRLLVWDVWEPIVLGGRWWQRQRVPFGAAPASGYCLECYQEVNNPAMGDVLYKGRQGLIHRLR